MEIIIYYNKWLELITSMYEEIIDRAYDSMLKSYSPYSNFRVGAALFGIDGNIYTGTNIENESYGATICAERVAVFNCVSTGIIRIKQIAIISDVEEFVYPCGICRQVISEFSEENTKIICCKNKKVFKVFTIGELLPIKFEFKKFKF